LFQIPNTNQSLSEKAPILLLCALLFEQMRPAGGIKKSPNINIEPPSIAGFL
jgi:hypothetical protein